MIKDGSNVITAADFVIVTTAGEALSARDACYISSGDGKAYKCDADDIAKIGFAGFAGAAAALNAAVNIVGPGKMMTGFAGLTRGPYYLSGTAGLIATTPGACRVKVGDAVSATVIDINCEDRTGSQTVIPIPHGLLSGTTTYNPTTTTQALGHVFFPTPIMASKVTFNVSTFTSSGTLDITLYSEDGQTRIFSITTGTISGTGLVSTAISPAVFIPAGNYYIGINSNGANVVVPAFNYQADYDHLALGGAVASEPKMSGTIVITANTPATTITPTSLTAAEGVTLAARFDA